jgi:hypothetical protein
MAKVTIHRPTGDFTVEDITFEQVKELVGVNGYGSHSAQPSPVSASTTLPIRSDYRGFLDHLSERGRLFIHTLKHNPMGIEANDLAAKLSFNDARQIGGLTGGGIAKIAKRHGIKVKEIYKVETKFPNGKRTVTFYPCKLVFGPEQEKPAV